ncbi:MAG: GLPGLI family protein [Prevotellaceae bacterium]|nr:GLPGLI family protein [Prevotellaceae bacterium]
MLMLLPALGVCAQSGDSIDVARLTAVYSYTVRTADAEGQAVTDSVRLALQIGGKVAKSMPYADYVAETTGEYDYEEAYAAACVHVPTVWQNHPQGLLTERELILLNDYEASGKLPETEWELTGDTLTVGGYACSSATARLAGLRWKVWYTEDVPSGAGPWKLQGLPGLIVSGSDEEETHKFELLGMLTEPAAITYTPNAKVIKLGMRQLVKFRNKTYGNKEYLKNPFYGIDSSSIESASILTAGGSPKTIINGHLVASSVHAFKPLELDK